jgi:hypothetical protein
MLNLKVIKYQFVISFVQAICLENFNPSKTNDFFD